MLSVGPRKDGGGDDRREGVDERPGGGDALQPGAAQALHGRPGRMEGGRGVEGVLAG